MRSRIYGNFVLLLFVMASNCALCQTIKCDFSSANNVIEANINGGQKVRLMLDSGLNISVLSLQCVTQIKLSMEVNHHYNSSYEFITLPFDLTIAKIKMKNIRTLVGDFYAIRAQNKLNPNLPIDGVLGLDILSHFAIGLDTAHSTATFWRNGCLTRKQRTLWKNRYPEITSNGPIRWRKDDFISTPGRHSKTRLVKVPLHLLPSASHMYMLYADVDGIRARLGLDIGTTHPTFTKRFSHRLRPQVVFGQRKITAFDGEETGILEYLRVIRIKQVTFRYPPVIAFDANPETPKDGLVGLYLFGNGRFIIDFPAKTLYVVPPRNNILTAIQRAGIFLEGMKNVRRRFIAHIAANSLAAKIGMKNKDIITKIMQIDASRGRKPYLEFTVERKGQPKSLEFEFRYPIFFEY